METMPPANEFDALAAQIYRERVLRARQMSPGEKLRDGLELWEGVFERMKCGVSIQHPTANEAEQFELLLRQRDRLRRMHEHGIYQIQPVFAPR